MTPSAELRKLLVPVHFITQDDGTLAVAADSMEAVEQGLDLAHCQTSRVTFTHVFAGEGAAGTSSDDGDLPEIHRVMDQLVEGAASQGIDADIEFLFGHPYHEIASFAASDRYDLVVVGTRLRPGEDGCLLGSTATRLVQESAGQTWIAKRRCLGHGGVIIAIDLSPSSLTVLRRGLDLAHCLDAQLHLVHAFGVDDGGDQEVDAELQLRRLRLESQMAKVVGDEPIPSYVSHVQLGSPEVVIWDVARREHADVVVVGLGDRSACQRLIHPDTAKEVLSELPCSLLTVRVE